MKLKRLVPIANSLCVGGALAAGASNALAADADSSNEDLKARVSALEELLQKEGITPSSVQTPKFVKAMSDITISGFVTASYFYDTSHPANNSPNAYLWNRTSSAFTLNKFKLSLASKPVEASGTDWSAGFKTSLIFGSDAPIVNTGGNNQGWSDVREAYVEMNVPVGTGLNVKAGQLISLLNYESGDGGAVNENFSQGNQWFYTGNGPSAGVQLGYTFTPWLDAKVRVQNGMYSGPFDNNTAKTLMAEIGLKPDSKSWINLIGFGGQESTALKIRGASLLAGYQFTPKLGSGLEFDYFNFDGSAVGPVADDEWSIGGWLWYDFTSKVGLALRAEYINDATGFGTSGLLGFPSNNGGSLYGVTLTLNYKPVPNLKIQPEVRFDGTGVSGGFGSQTARVIVGCGASYLF
jgi:Putative beta-barrel porin-2, OmpL-like. bbp2